MSAPHILLVDGNHKERAFLLKSLEEWGYHVMSAHDGHSALKKIKSGSYGLVISGFEIAGLSGQEFFHHARAEDDTLQFLFLSDTASVESAVEMMKAGVLDFFIRPVDPSQIRLAVQSVFEANGGFGTPSGGRAKQVRIVTCNQEMQRLLELAKQVSDSKASVLIQGESGTGKELVARFIHENSARSGGSFVALNCGALPETLLESELFGHEKGAFTGAIARKLGKFEMANGGTILLDEITEMVFHLQAKLLRVLQEQEIDRVGGLRPIPVDVRVIATTNQNLQEAIEKKAFRQDLFYRLNVVPIRIPPLRSRPCDIPLLAQHFIEKYNEIDGRNVKSLTKEAIEKLGRLPFSGNVRVIRCLIFS